MYCLGGYEGAQSCNGEVGEGTQFREKVGALCYGKGLWKKEILEKRF